MGIFGDVFEEILVPAGREIARGVGAGIAGRIAGVPDIIIRGGPAAGTPFAQFPTPSAGGLPSALPFELPQPAPGSEGFMEGLGTFISGTGACPPLFRTGNATTMRPISEFSVQHPQTGKLVTWGVQGRVILRASDLVAARKVKRVARLAAKSATRPRKRRR